MGRLLGIHGVLNACQTVIARVLESARRISITLIEAREINGRYTGSLQGLEQGSVATKDYFL